MHGRTWMVAALLMAGCSARAPEASDGAVAVPDAPVDGALVPPDGAAPDAGTPVTPAPRTSPWSTVFAALDSKMYLQGAAIDGAHNLYVIVGSTKSFAWGNQVAIVTDTVYGRAFAAQVTPTGGYGWIHPLDGKYAYEAAIAASGDHVYAVVPSFSSGGPSSYWSQTVVSLASADGAERWRWAVPVLTHNQLSIAVSAVPGSVWLHGNYAWAQGSYYGDAPYLQRLSEDGVPDPHAWQYSIDADYGPYQFPWQKAIGTGLTLPVDDGVVIAGYDGIERWGTDGIRRYTAATTGWFSGYALVRAPDGKLVFLGATTGDGVVLGGHPVPNQRSFVATIDPDSGQIGWVHVLPPSFSAGTLAVSAERGDVIVTGGFHGLVDFDGELRAGHGPLDTSTDGAIVVLDHNGQGRAVMAFGTEGDQWAPAAYASDDGVTLVGHYEQPASPTVAFHVGLTWLSAGNFDTTQYAIFLPWSDLDTWIDPPCGDLSIDLTPVQVDLHLVVDIARGMSSSPGGDGVRLRQLVGNSVVATSQWPHEPGLFRRMTTTPAPVYDQTSKQTRCNALAGPVSNDGALFSVLQLAPDDLDPDLFDGLSGVFNFARPFSLGYTDGAVRDTAAVVIASSDAPAAGCGRGPADLAALAAGALAGPVPVRTHVIGVGAPSAELDQLAAAGGTGQARYVAAGVDLATTVGAALASVRDQHRCTLVGDHQRIDHVPLAAATLTVNQAEVPRVDSCAPGGAGWMIDRLSTWAPSVHLCDATCAAVWAPTLTEGPTLHAQVTCAP